MKLKNHFNLLLAITLMFSIYSCSGNKNNNQTSTNEQDSIIEKGCEGFLKSGLNDPTSYQRVSISLIDTTFKLEDLENNLDIFYPKVDEIERSILPKERLLEREAQRDSIIKVIALLKENPKQNEILYFNYEIKYRAKNKMGALVMSRALVLYMPNEKEGSKFVLFFNE
jgi:hypothetical protein